MITDFGASGDVTTPADATIVIGAGAAGLALTLRLASRTTPVLLFESGTDLTASGDEQASADELNQGVISGQAYVGLTRGRKRIVGGAAQLWHGQCMRLHPLDLAHRPWLSGSGWPLTLAELEDGYTAAEAWLDVTGLGYGADRWQEHPRLAPLEWDSRYLLHDFTEYAPRPLLGREHRAELAANPDVWAFTNATVARVVVDAEGVCGVELVTTSGRRLVPARRVVLAAGAIENARLLQLSDPERVGLGAGREHTGRFLQDHPVIETATVTTTDHRVLQDRFTALHRGKRRLFPKVRLAPDAQERFELVDATAVFVHEHDDASLAAARRVLAAMRGRGHDGKVAADLLTAARAPAPMLRDAYRRWVRGLSSGARPSRVTLQLWLEQQPDQASFLRLSDQLDRFGLPLVDVNWRVGAREMETSRRMTRWIGAELDRLGVGTLREQPVMDDDDAWHGAVTDAYHPSGTTRMSVDPRAGVVDTDLNVHGIDGLYVVGSSVFPIAGYANPTLTIVALAMRLADRLRAVSASSKSMAR